VNNILTKSVVGSTLRKMEPESPLGKALFKGEPRGTTDERVVVLQVMYCSDKCIFVEYIGV